MASSQVELAERAGAEPANVDHLLALGVFRALPDGSFTSGDVRRVVLLKTLERAGLPLQGIVAAIRDNQLMLDMMDSEVWPGDLSLSLPSPMRDALSRNEPQP